jgi:hypothetical protein
MLPPQPGTTGTVVTWQSVVALCGDSWKQSVDVDPVKGGGRFVFSESIRLDFLART